MDTTYINYDVKQAERISYKIINPYYSKYCAVHANSNENLKGISKLLQLKNKDILLTGSSADQYLTFVLAGAKTSVIFDINLLAKYYIYLKIGAIKALNYDDFIKFIIPNNKNYLNKQLLKKISDYIPKDTMEFWNIYLNNVSMNMIGNFIYSGEETFDNIKRNISFYNREDYEKLKKIIESQSYPKFINTDIALIENYIKKGDIFDIIYLSNIIGCQIDDFSYECKITNTDSWIRFIKTVLSRHLSTDGQILVDYDLYSCNGSYNSALYKCDDFDINTLPSNNYDGKSAVLTYKPKRK